MGWFEDNAPEWLKNAATGARDMFSRIESPREGVTVAQDRYTRTPIVWDKNQTHPTAKGVHVNDRPFDDAVRAHGARGTLIPGNQRGYIEIVGAGPGEERPDVVHHEILHAMTVQPLLDDPELQERVKKALPAEFQGDPKGAYEGVAYLLAHPKYAGQEFDQARRDVLEQLPAQARQKITRMLPQYGPPANSLAAAVYGKSSQ